jgi:hypothetical protein
MLKRALRFFTSGPQPAQAIAPIRDMPLRSVAEAQQVVTALCRESMAQRREIEELRRRLDDRDGGAVVLTPINPASRCPAVSGSASGPAGCPRVSSNYAADGLYTGDPKNWVPPACPLCG